jgi:hypothetical protein
MPDSIFVSYSIISTCSSQSVKLTKRTLPLDHQDLVEVVPNATLRNLHSILLPQKPKGASISKWIMPIPIHWLQ